MCACGSGRVEVLCMLYFCDWLPEVTTDRFGHCRNVLGACRESRMLARSRVCIVDDMDGIEGSCR